MDTPIQAHKYPIDTYDDGDKVEDVKRLCDGVTDMLGPVVVGGWATSDCFQREGQIHAGLVKKEGYGDGDGDYDDIAYNPTPRTEPW